MDRSDQLPQPTRTSGRTDCAIAAFRLWVGFAILLFAWGCSGRSRPPLAPDIPPGRPTSPAPSGTTPVPILPPPQLEVLIEPSTIQRGESALLRWEAQNADRVRIDHNIGVVEASGRIRFFPDETTSYELVAEGPGGETAKAVTVSVRLDNPVISNENLASETLAERFGRIVEPVFFTYDSTELSAEAQEILDASIQWLKRPENSGIRFLIEGHCDERGTDEYNLALGDRRAQAAHNYMAAAGIPISRIATLSLGEERPFDPRPTEAGWALNRRAHFVMQGERR